MLSPAQINELLSFTNGEPIIVTPVIVEDLITYNLVIYVKTLADSKPTYISSVTANLSLKPGNDIYPFVKLKDSVIFHPNFTIDGIWIDSNIKESETISDYLFRLVRVLQFKEINREHIGDRNAMAWYNKNSYSGIFPTDLINYHSKPHISIVKVNHH
jgi:hypothetical protein